MQWSGDNHLGLRPRIMFLTSPTVQDGSSAGAILSVFIYDKRLNESPPTPCWDGGRTPKMPRSWFNRSILDRLRRPKKVPARISARFVVMRQLLRYL